MATSDLLQFKEKAAREILAGDWKGALKALQKAQELAPKDTYVAMKIGDMQQRLGNKPAAIQAYKAAAALFAAAGFLIKAISVNKIVLSLDPADREVQQALAALYAEQTGEIPPPGPSEEPPVQTPGPVTGIEIELAQVDRRRLPRTPLFSDLTAAELGRVIDRLVPVVAAAGTVVCVEGEPAHSMFIIAHGLVSVSGHDSAGHPLWLTNLSDGDFFGEFGLLGDGRRHAQVAAVEDTELLEIGRSQIQEIQAEFPRVQEVLLRFFKERVLDTVLARSNLFRGLSAAERHELLGKAGLQAVPTGTDILVEGQEGEQLYLIKSGEVEVFTGLGDQHIGLARLQAGEIFGEISVLTGMPATANVRSSAPTELMTFSRVAVVALAEQNPQLAHLLSATKEHRVHETVARLLTEGFV